jgi:hypothetical protein
MEVVAQSVRASVCGAEGRGFESHQPPKKSDTDLYRFFFALLTTFESNTYSCIHPD